jgi:predicted MFS family arabinose efflux permease
VLQNNVCLPSQATIFSLQALRAFSYGFGSVLLGATLARDGDSPVAVGLLLAAITAGMALGSLAVGGLADHLGRRHTYRALLLLMLASGLVFALTASLPWLALAGLTGTLATDANDSGPLSTLEQAMLGRLPAVARTRAYGHYNAAAYAAGASGALAAALPALLATWSPRLGPGHAWFLVYVVAAAGALVLSTRLNWSVETTAPQGSGRRLDAPVRRRVLLISGLFAADSMGGGFLAQSFIAFWLGRRFGVGVEVLGPVFFVGGLLQGVSALLASPLARRYGLVRTVAWSQIPGHILILFVAWAPSLWVAVPCLLVRYVLTQTDMPARQAFVMAAVPEGNQLAAAAYTNTSRYVLRPVSPLLAGALMQILLPAPFLAGAAIKLAYNVGFYLSFRELEVDAPRLEPVPLQAGG